ncbi:hypothetical protein M3Y99_01301000 [Aphelenchoides fujianensis]|nr:hypothetical protein M3Y99_01301000 [Aphelenchoides fujianensis]
MNSTGLAYLTPEQVHHLYGPHSPYNNTEMLEKSRRLNHSRMHDYVEEDIHAISEAQKWNIRQKDIVLSPITFTWLALVPALASQPLVLSPVIFSPLILSPSVYGFVILSVFNPLILSPSVLTPLILSPQFVLSPIIGSPQTLGGLILSPPVLLSPLTAFAAILSPSWLS